MEVQVDSSEYTPADVLVFAKISLVFAKIGVGCIVLVALIRLYFAVTCAKTALMTPFL